MRRVLPLLFALGSLAVIAQPQPQASFNVRSLIESVPRSTMREQADVAFNAGSYNDAIEKYEQWLRVAPADAEGAYMLARAYAAVSRTLDAANALELAVVNGLADADRLYLDPALEPLQRQSVSLARVLLANRRIDSVTAVMYSRQMRIGKSRVTFPAGYDPKKKYRLGILLHGNGHSEKTMSQWARQLSLVNIIWVSPQAPYLKITESMAAFREKYSAAGDGQSVPDSLLDDIVDASAEWYRNVIRDAREKLPLTIEKPIVIGFSQGGFYAHVLATRYPADIGSIVSMGASMYAIGRVTNNYGVMRRYGIDALVLHGLNDDVVPLQTAELIHASMESAGVNHLYRTFAGSHWPTAEANTIIKQWIEQRGK